MLQMTTEAGWTTKLGVKRILAPYLTHFDSSARSALDVGSGIDPRRLETIDMGSTDDEALEDYEPFRGLGYEAAQRLLAVLPGQNLSDRQNYGPTTEALLRAAVNNPGEVDLVGYAIGPARPDERVSIEGFVYYGLPQFNVLVFHESGCECEVLWDVLQRKLGLESALDRPDEIHRIRPDWRPGSEGWWVWWD